MKTSQLKQSGGAPLARRSLWIPIVILVTALTAVSHPQALGRDQAKGLQQTGQHNIASFYVEVVREVNNDWATARLSVVEEGEDAARVANLVNRRMTKAVAAAKAIAGIEVNSGAYVTHPVHRDGRIASWRAQQELRIESQDVDRLSALIGKLQGDSVLLSGIDFSLRRETRKSLEDELIEEALSAFRVRATRIAKSLDASAWSLVDLSINGGDHAPQRYPMRARAAMAMTASGAPPALEAGSSEIRIQIDGSIELKFDP